MTWLWTVLVIVATVAWVVALVDIVKRRHELSGASLAAWILIIIIFPVLGTILYFVVGRRG